MSGAWRSRPCSKPVLNWLSSLRVTVLASLKPAALAQLTAQLVNFF
eukprot:COSAG05_NODE_26228_length_190_cov_20.791209_1_plen_45_part_10